MSSPAERFAAAQINRDYPFVAEFADLYPFGLDEFQRTACGAIEDGMGVLLAAPTGAGKTVVGEFAVHLALEQGRKCFYTTPIKALSNQKFNDLVERYGSSNVGLLTGDNTINGEAPVVVMTTEVLRNMLYARSRTLNRLGFVVMDEVHYLADRFRGAVWEEVIISLPESVSVVSLSATVSNAEEFGDWLTEVRGNNVTIVEEVRPVPLYQHVMVGQKMFPLFDRDAPDRVNHQLERIARDDWHHARPAKGRGGKRHRPYNKHPSRHNRSVPSRGEVVDQLEFEGLLPAIIFIFSRAGCAAAVRQCLDRNMRLTSLEEREEIARYVEFACADLPAEDREVLNFYEFRDGLLRGISSHHAGLLPTFKECVEELFSRGLVKVVFATETLALGINMPARSVVIEKLSKWNGETHADITPGEYTQLTGRAGRRGIDVEGHGVVLWQPGMDPKAVAGLASRRTYPLNSSFRPSYNMAVNLVDQVGSETARDLLEQSFAQFQADRSVVGMARQVRKAEEALAGYGASIECERGDFLEYARLRRELKDVESRGVKRRKAAEREDVIESLLALRHGDIITVPGGRWSGLAVVVDPGSQGDRNGPRPLVLTHTRHARRLAIVDFPQPVESQGKMRIPKSFNARNPQARKDLAASLHAKTRGLTESHHRGPKRGRDDESESAIAAIRMQLREHPCHDCPDRESHARWAERYVKLERETQGQRRRIENRTNTIARQFDRVCDVLAALGYLEAGTVTADGRRLQRLYGELDLLAGECIRRDTWAGLDAAELASALSGLTFETRGTDDAPAPRLPHKNVAAVAHEMASIGAALQVLEREHRLNALRRPDFGFAWSTWRWANGASLDEVLGESEMAAGDFVRAMKQLLDVVAQIADAAGAGPLRDTARASMDLLKRGVVAYTSVAAQ